MEEAIRFFLQQKRFPYPQHVLFEQGPNFKEEKRRFEEAARRTLQKDRRINIRISARDLERIQKRAVTEGIPYQTLIASTLHKFVTGKLKDAE